MLSAYLATAIVIATSLAVGRALFRLVGQPRWTGLEAAIGLAGLFAITGLAARLPGHSRTVAVALAALLLATLVVLVVTTLRDRRIETEADGSRVVGSPLAALVTVVAVLAALGIPFLVNGRFGPIGVGVNNDLGLHLAWAEWLRSELGPVPAPGYPLGPHGLATGLARVPGIDLLAGFTGVLMSLFAITAITALSAVRPLVGRMARGAPRPVTFELPGLAAVVVAVVSALAYLAVAYYAQAAFKEAAVALFALTVALLIPWFEAGLRRWRMLALLTVLAGGIVFSYSFPGLAWPIAIGGLWLATRREVWRALKPTRLHELILDRFTLTILAGLALAAIVFVFSGRFGFGELFGEVAGSDTYGPVSPVQALGIWPEANYRIAAAGWPALAVPAAAIVIAGLIAALIAQLRNGFPILPVALAACALVYLASLPFSGDYSRAKALMILSPIAMLTILSALLAGPLRAIATFAPHRAWRAGWVALAAIFLTGAIYSSFLVLRDARVAPPGHTAELRELVPLIEGRSVLYAGQDRYAAFALRGADGAVPIVEFPDDRITESKTKPFDTGSAYSPIDFDSFTPETLDRFRFVITGSAAWNSQAPPNFEEVARTRSFVLWERDGPTPEGHTLVEGINAAAPFDCAAPENRLLSNQPGFAGILPDPAIAARADWTPERILGPGESAAVRLELTPGRWLLSLQYFAPGDLILEGPGLELPLKATADGQRPAAITLANDGQFWPAGEVTVTEPGPVELTVRHREDDFPARVLGADRPAFLGNLVALPDRDRMTVPLAEACGSWMDWYASETVP